MLERSIEAAGRAVRLRRRDVMAAVRSSLCFVYGVF